MIKVKCFFSNFMSNHRFFFTMFDTIFWNVLKKIVIQNSKKCPLFIHLFYNYLFLLFRTAPRMGIYINIVSKYHELRSDFYRGRRLGQSPLEMNLGVNI